MKLANAASLNMSTFGRPHCLMCRNRPQQRWWSVFGGYSVPSFFLTSSTKWLIQYWSCSLSMASIFFFPLLHDSIPKCTPFFFYNSTQYLVSAWVFLGTWVAIAIATSSLVFGVANLEASLCSFLWCSRLPGCVRIPYLLSTVQKSIDQIRMPGHLRLRKR